MDVPTGQAPPPRHLDVRRLGLLRDLERLGTVTAVARRAHLTPTAVSQQLKTLEREAGASLLRRVGRRVELTDAGRVLCDAAGEVEQALERVQARWDDYHGEVRGTVRLSVFPTAAQGLLPHLLTALARHPGLELEVVEADLHGDEYAARTDLADVVLAHRASVDGAWSGAVSQALWRRRGVRVVDLVEEPLDVGVPPGHPLAGTTRPVEVEDVRAETWVGVPAGWPFDRALLAWFAAAGAPAPQVTHRFADLRTQQALVGAGHGLALLPRHAARLGDTGPGEGSGAGSGAGRPVLLPTAAPVQTRRIAALARADQAERAAVRVVLEALREVAPRYSGHAAVPTVPTSPTSRSDREGG